MAKSDAAHAGLTAENRAELRRMIHHGNRVAPNDILSLLDENERANAAEARATAAEQERDEAKSETVGWKYRELELQAHINAKPEDERPSNWPCCWCGYGHSAAIDHSEEQKLIRAEATVIAKEQQIAALTAALRSIAKNSCCGGCREAALVASTALQNQRLLAALPAPVQATEPTT